MLLIGRIKNLFTGNAEALAIVEQVEAEQAAEVVAEPAFDVWPQPEVEQGIVPPSRNVTLRARYDREHGQ